MNKIEELEKKMEEIKEEIDQLKKQENSEDWTPKDHEEYYYVDLDLMEVNTDVYNGHSMDKLRIENKVVFETEEEAESYLEYLEAKREAINEFSKEEWTNIEMKKYLIEYNHSDNKIYVNYYFEVGVLNTPFFRTEEEAEEFIEKYEKWIKREMGA
jgi:hypothetical protein